MAVNLEFKTIRRIYLVNSDVGSQIREYHNIIPCNRTLDTCMF